MSFSSRGPNAQAPTFAGLSLPEVPQAGVGEQFVSRNPYARCTEAQLAALLSGHSYEENRAIIQQLTGEQLLGLLGSSVHTLRSQGTRFLVEQEEGSRNLLMSAAADHSLTQTPAAYRARDILTRLDQRFAETLLRQLTSDDDTRRQAAIDQIAAVCESTGSEDGRIQEFVAMCAPSHALNDASVRSALPDVLITFQAAAASRGDSRFAQLAEQIIERQGGAAGALRKQIVRSDT